MPSCSKQTDNKIDMHFQQPFSNLSFPLKVFTPDGKLDHFIDGRGEHENWMKFVNCARQNDEQNLVLVQDGDQVYYESSREILRGEELLVWYGNRYHMFMGIPTGIKTLPAKAKDRDVVEGRAFLLTPGQLPKFLRMRASCRNRF